MTKAHYTYTYVVEPMAIRCLELNLRLNLNVPGGADGHQLPRRRAKSLAVEVSTDSVSLEWLESVVPG